MYQPYAPYTPSSVGMQRGVQGDQAPQPNQAMPALTALTNINTATPAGQTAVNNLTAGQLPNSKEAANDLMKKIGIDPSQFSGAKAPAGSDGSGAAGGYGASLDGSPAGQALNQLFGFSPQNGMGQQGMSAMMGMMNGQNGQQQSGTGQGDGSTDPSANNGAKGWGDDWFNSFFS